MVHDSFGNAAKKQTTDSAAAVTSDNDQISRPTLGAFDYLCAGFSQLNEFKRSWLCGRPLPECAEEILSVAFRHRAHYIGWYATARLGKINGIDHVDKS
jgi:hypothetical protein